MLLLVFFQLKNTYNNKIYCINQRVWATELNVLKISIKSNCSNMSFRISVALLIFCLEDQSTDVSEVLKSLLLYSHPFVPLALLVFVFCISVQFSSVAEPCPTLCHPMDCSTPGFPVHHQLHSLPKLMSLDRWCHPTISSSVVPFSSHLQSFTASGSFQMLVLHIRWPKHWSFRFSISPSNKYSGMISIRIDWLDLLAVQGILKSLLQHHSSKALLLRHSAFFIARLSHPYMTATPGSCRNSRKPMRLSPPCEMRPDSPALCAEQMRFPNQTRKEPQFANL